METINKWTERDHAVGYLSVADRIPHRKEGEGVLLEHIPAHTNRILDLGCGDGRLLALALKDRPKAAQGVALDFSPAMLQRARERFSGSPNITVIEHNLDRLLPELGSFDAVVSSFAIHHCSHERKRSLYEEVFRILRPGGIFCNLEHVSSPTQRLHARFLTAIGESVETEDPSNKLLEVETQLAWLRSIGFEDVDCHWKWLELALLCGSKPA
ncbi:MAG: methyltransferase [Acidobacteria bacterium]|nr:MAG: methyltransferase [Acidobacteriota bacterium]